MDFNQGTPLPLLQQKDFENQTPWAPVTPAKPDLGKRLVIPSNAYSISNGQSNMGSLGMTMLEPLNVAVGFYGGKFPQESTDGRTDVYSSIGQLQDHSGRDAASLVSCDQSRGHQAISHATDVSTMTFRNSVHGWEQSSYMKLMASTHEAGTTKVPFYTPLMLSQIGEGLRMPVPLNLSVLNENVLLDHSLYNSSNYQTRTSQYGAFSPLIPKCLSEGKIDVKHVMSCPHTPLTMENNKYAHGWLPNQSIDSEDYCRSERTAFEKVEKWPGPIGKRAAVCISTTLIPHPLESTMQYFSAPQVLFESTIDSQQQNAEAANAIVSSEKDFSQHLNVEEHINIGIDLNKTPRQKPKKKKHRPKVIQEGKPKRTPKSTPPKSVTPKTPLKKEEKPSGKRKYVRKKKVQDPSENLSLVPAEIANISDISGTKSARRRLNFDVEIADLRNELPGHAVSVIHNEECQAPEVCFMEISNKSTTKLSMQNAQGTEIVLDNSPNGMKFSNSDGLMHQNTEHTKFPKETAPAYQVCREETLKTSQLHDERQIMSEHSNMPSQQSKVGSIYKEYYELTRKSDHRIIANPEKSQNDAAPAQFNSNQMLNLLLEVKKIRHNLSNDVSTLEEMNGTQTYARVPDFHDVHHDGPYLPQGYKKQRREVDQDSFDPNVVTSSVKAPPKDWRKGHVVIDNAGHLSCIKEKEFMALEKQKVSDSISSPEQTKNKRGKQLLLPPEGQSLISADQSVIKLMDTNKSLDHMMPFTCNKIYEQRSCALQKYIINAKRKTRRHVHKEQSQTLPLSYAQVDIPTSGNFGKKVQFTSNNSIIECQSSSNCSDSFGDTLNSGALVVKRDPLSDIIEKLKCLSINETYEDHAHQTPYAIVTYNGGGVMVPYEGLDDLVKKRRTRPKVDLDPESNRVWNLLMGKQSTDVVEEMDITKEKWWEEERRVFHGRVDSFIARMHLVQGDRRFSKWKGSVVDSVVGVFLTQNVSDHLSSSAFMALGARFPARCNNKETSAEKGNLSMEQENSGIYIDDTKKLQKQLLGRESYNCDSLVIVEENKTVNVNKSCGSNTGGCEYNNKNAQSLHTNETALESDWESPNSVSGIQVRLTRGTSTAEAEDMWSLEDMASSQKSVVSSQNHSVDPDEAVHQQIGLRSRVEPENLAMRSLCSETSSSTSFTELLHIADRIPLMKYDGKTSWFSQVEGRNSILGLQGDAGGRNVPVFRSNVSLGDLASPSMPHHIEGPSRSRLMEIATVNIKSGNNILSEHSTNDFELNDALSSLAANSTTKTNLRNLSLIAETASYGPTSNYCEQLTSSQKESWDAEKFCLHANLHAHKADSSITKSSTNCSSVQNQCSPSLMNNMNIHLKSTQDGVNFQQTSFSNQQSTQSKHSKDRTSLEVSHAFGTNIDDDACSSKMIPAETSKDKSKEKKTKVDKERKKTYEWDSLRRALHFNGTKKERSQDTMDSIDWEAVRHADVSKISETIRERGMNNVLAERIKEFLDRLVRDHGNIDLEWLRDVEPDKAKDYLLSIRGLGLKSVECLRLLTLHHLAFPVDTNVGRICVRLGWVPLQPLPESLQLHLLELYPMLETIQKYLWPRLCKLDQRTLYELHYQLITFGKVFCTKSKPNCNACPMRGECKHFASAFASARLALPDPEIKDIVTSTGFLVSENNCIPDFNSRPQPQIKEDGETQGRSLLNTCEPIIEEPATPENECVYTEESAIEDAFYEDPDEIPTIKLNIEEFTHNLQSYIQENNKEIQDGDISKALVAITQAASIPMPKLKNIRRLRTEHHVYQLPDSHPLLEGFDKREPDDPSPYLLAIWTPGETAQSTEPPEVSCNSQETGNLCNKETCFSCNSIREAQAQTVRATILIPCRTAMRGSFPLNGTYFQVNEVFADHNTSRNPIDVPRNWIWNLPRRTVYFGTSVPSIFKGLTTEEIQQCFWRGFVCVRGFDQTTRAPRPLYARLHFPASKTKNKKEAAAATTKAE